MKYLVDSNIFLEILLEQEKKDEARELLARIDVYDFFVTDFTLHSIGVRMFKEKRFEKFWLFIKEMVVDAGTIVVVLHNEDTKQIIHNAATLYPRF